MRLKTIISGVIIILITILSVMAFSTVEKTAPFTQYQTFTTLNINISGGVNASGIYGLKENATVNVTILNKSSSSGSYGALFSGTLNASGVIKHYFWNKTVTLTEERHWIRLNFTNATSGGLLTNTTIIDIDLEYDVITIGQDAFNFSTVTGNLNISGILKANEGFVSGKSVMLGNLTSTGLLPCTAANIGLMSFSGHNLTFWGCNGNNWLNLSGS